MKVLANYVYPRAIAVAGLIFICLAVLFISSHCSSKSSLNEEAESSTSQILNSSLSSSLFSEEDASDAAVFKSTLLDSYSKTELSEVLRDEVWSGQTRNLLVSQDGSILSFYLDKTVDSAASEVTKELESHGWTLVPSGSDALCSYIKDEGSFHWAAVSITAFEENSQVLMLLRGQQ